MNPRKQLLHVFQITFRANRTLDGFTFTVSEIQCNGRESRFVVGHVNLALFHDVNVTSIFGFTNDPKVLRNPGGASVSPLARVKVIRKVPQLGVLQLRT
jgi:hypothetical protein